MRSGGSKKARTSPFVLEVLPMNLAVSSRSLAVVTICVPLRGLLSSGSSKGVRLEQQGDIMASKSKPKTVSLTPLTASRCRHQNNTQDRRSGCCCAIVPTPTCDRGPGHWTDWWCSGARLTWTEQLTRTRSPSTNGEYRQARLSVMSYMYKYM